VGIDRNYNAGQFTTRIIAAGVLIIEVPQNVVTFTEPMEHLDAVIIADRIHHNRAPILSRAIGNVVAKKGAIEECTSDLGAGCSTAHLRTSVFSSPFSTLNTQGSPGSPLTD
jgi:hypothetical protein